MRRQLKPLTKMILKNQFHIEMSEFTYDFETPYGIYKLYHVYRTYSSGKKELKPEVVKTKEDLIYIQYSIQYSTSYKGKRMIEFDDYPVKVTAQRLFCIYFKGLDFPEYKVAFFDNDPHNMWAGNLYFTDKDYLIQKKGPGVNKLRAENERLREENTKLKEKIALYEKLVSGETITLDQLKED